MTLQGMGCLKPQSAKELQKHRQPDTTNCRWHYKAWAVWKTTICQGNYKAIGNLIPQTADGHYKAWAVWKLQSAKETTKHRQPDTTNCRWHYKAWACLKTTICQRNYKAIEQPDTTNCWWHYKAWAVWKPQSAKEITKHRQPDTTNCRWHCKAWAVWKPQSAKETTKA